VLADIPGLIEGAHEGLGLGDRFLGHVERCRVLLHLVDGTQDDVAKAYKTIRKELKAYGGGLAEKREIVALSKVDSLSEEEREEKAAALKKAARRVPILLSAPTGENVEKTLRALRRAIDDVDAADEETYPKTSVEPWRP
jgi:GTP-binding protein